VERPNLSQENIKKLENVEATAIGGQPIHHQREAPWVPTQREPVT